MRGSRLPIHLGYRYFRLPGNAARSQWCRIAFHLSLFAVLSLATAAGVLDRASAATPQTSSHSLKTMVDFRDGNLIRQRYDFSCGAAALATILRYGLGDQVTEQQIVADLFAGLEGAEAIKRETEGFSLYDLQQVALRRGYKAEGYMLEPQDLSKLNGPVIVFLETMGYKHFAVLKGVRGDRVYLADPSRGNIRMPAYRFLDSWLKDGKGIIFVVEPGNNRSDIINVLRPEQNGIVQPEIVAVRELLAMRRPFKAN